MSAAGRTTTARLNVGDQILVEPAGSVFRSTTRKLTGRNDVVVATITALDQAMVYGSGRRSTRLTTITTDVGVIPDCPPSQTFAVAPSQEV